VAGSSIATASHNKRSTKASAQADAQAAAANFQNIVTMFSNSIASSDPLDASDLKSAIQGYVGMMQTISKLSVSDGNSTGFTPNWEGAVIGAVINSHLGLLTGALMGVTTSWSYKGLNDGLTSILGFDPMQALTGSAGGLPGGLPLLPNSIVPDAAPAPKSPVAAPAPAPKPVVPAPAPKPVVPVPAPKPVVAAPPVAPVAAPKPPVPATPQVPTSPAAPKAAQPPVNPMQAMGHGHGAWVDTPYGQERK